MGRMAQPDQRFPVQLPGSFAAEPQLPADLAIQTLPSPVKPVATDDDRLQSLGQPGQQLVEGTKHAPPPVAQCGVDARYPGPLGAFPCRRRNTVGIRFPAVAEIRS